MLYLTLPGDTPVQYLSCGQLIKNKNFLHPRRCLESFVLIYVLEGTLYISQNGIPHEIGEDQFILLHANTEHYGYKEYPEFLHYYWVHFLVPGEHYCIAQDEYYPSPSQSNKFHYVLPEFGSLDQEKRVPILFSQILDISMQEYIVSDYLLHFSLTSLLMELASKSIPSSVGQESRNLHIYKIQDWIRHNYQQSITIPQIAEIFHFNPDYLSFNYKKVTGMPLTRYINSVRIEAAKKFLTTTEFSLREVAYYCGFSDEKYFFRVFKQFEGMTPTEFKGAFFKKKVVSK